MHCRSFALYVACALIGSSALAAGPNDYVGEWRGEVKPTDGSATYPAQITLVRRTDGTLTGTTLYASKCVGELKQSQADAAMFAFTETINYGKEHCKAGSVVVALDPSGQLDGVWTSSNGLAIAKLSRFAAEPPVATPPVEPPVYVISLAPESASRDEENRWKQQIEALVHGPGAAYPSDHDFMPTLLRLARTDSRSLGLMNYLIAMPEYAATRSVFDYAAGLAERFKLQTDAVRTVQNNLRIQLDNADGDANSGAIARALQSLWDKILRLEERASSGRDPDASRRYAQLLDLAHSTKALEQLMQISAQQYEVRRRLLERYERLERLDSPGRAEYIAGYQVIVLRTALSSFSLDQAKKSTAEMDLKLNKALGELARGQILDFFGALFSGGGGGGAGSHSSGTTKICRDVFSEPQVIYNQYSGTYDTIPGNRIREDCY